MTTPTETPTTEDVITAWNNGDLTIDDADRITDVDGFTIQAHFEVQNGSVILTYSLDENLSFKPTDDGTGSTKFNILDETE